MPESISDLIRNANPDLPAILAPDHLEITYKDLQDLINTATTQLTNLGITRQDTIAIVLPNGPEMATTFLAASAAAIAAALNPNYSQDDFEFYLLDLNVKLLITQDNPDSPANRAAQKLNISTTQLQEIREGDATAEQKQTGHPSMRATWPDAPAEPPSTTTLPPNPDFQPDQFFHTAHTLNPTWYTAVPTMHQNILAHTTKNPDLPKNTHFRFIRSSSASLPPTTMLQLEETFNAPLIEAYGMTEAAHQITSNPLPPAQRKPGSVGPQAGPRIAIMNDQGDLLTTDEIGEVVIQGDNITTGYLNNDDANATAYTNGWFRTGDQGKIDQDGYLHLTGRLKEIINRGGEKISPREIDEAFMDHPAVAQAVAFALPHTTLGEDLAIAIVLKPDTKTTPQEIRDYAFEHLAPFKVPSQVVIVSQIPKGPTGKLKRIGLHEHLADSLKPEFIAPQNDFEEIIAQIWTDILPIENVGIHDNFFALGGDSLSPALVANQIASRFKIPLTPQTIFREPTIPAQALHAEDEIITQLESTPDES